MSNIWKYVLIGLLVFVLVFAVALPLVGGGGSRYGMGWGMMGPGMMGGGWGFGLLGPIVMLLLGVLVIGGMVWFVQTLARGGSTSSFGTTSGEAPLDILKRRYAAGEVTKEQFEEMRRTLGS
ncbi:MAG: SHOCT domain-containing protein [Bacteroidetes bacterium]|nr:SHOCT domain-containing protein [Bacteroidota bacterium]